MFSHIIYTKKNLILYVIILLKVLGFDQCDWYQHGEKSTKCFLNLEKKRGNQNQICKLIIDEKEIDGGVEILKKIGSFYEKCLCDITTPSLKKGSNKSLRNRLILN